MTTPEIPKDSKQPVGYDQYGRPLYLHPPESAPTSQEPNPQVVYLTRAIDPHKQEVPPEVRQKHDESARQFPQLHLSEGEYVISAVRRHPIGIVSIWAVVILAIVLVLVLPVIMTRLDIVPFELTQAAVQSGLMVIVLVAVLLIIAGWVAMIVYDGNRFYLTNESVMQHIQINLFHRKNQTISLGNIEDASFRQQGILQTFLNYGTLRLSTEGEETTYRFSFVDNPEHQVRLLNDAVEAFKNFRPIDEDATRQD